MWRRFEKKGLGFFFFWDCFVGHKEMAVQAQFPLCGSQDWVENGYGDGGGFNQLYCYYLQQEQQKQQLQQCNIQMIQNQLQKNQNLCFDNSFTGSSSSSLNTSNYQPSMAYSQCFSDDDEKQRQEIDHFIRLQVRNYNPSWVFNFICFCLFFKSIYLEN